MLAARAVARWRDVHDLLPFILRMWMYFAGVFFSVGIRYANAPHFVQVIAFYNPAAVYLQIMRFAFLDGTPVSWLIWFWAVVWAIGTVIIGTYRLLAGGGDLWQRLSRRQPARAARPATGHPTVIVDDVHVVYKVKSDRSTSTPKNRRMPAGPARLREVHAVRGVSFVAHEGEAIGLLGRNGSGKSTLLRVMTGLHPATKGAVYAQGQPTLLGVGAALIAELSGSRNIRLGGLAMGLTHKEIDEGYDDIVEFSGIGEFINNPLSTYSSGMGARLRFAIATSRTPPVLLIDEALATGDAAFRKKSEARIRQMRDEAGTIFIVSHSLSSILESCTRAIWLDGGKILADGDVEEVAELYKQSADKPTQ